MIKKSISMLNDTPGHDKVYHIQIIDSDQPNLFSVTFQYGKRGKKLTWGNRNGTQKKENVSYWEAEKYFNKKVDEELNKGYHIVPNPPDLMTLIGFTF